MTHNDHDYNVTGAFLAGFFLGGLVGAATALLTAPQSGQATREQIRDTAVEMKDKAEATVHDVEEQIQSTASDLSDQVKDLEKQAEKKVKKTRKQVEQAVQDVKQTVTGS